jgi:putative oxidoreductase
MARFTIQEENEMIVQWSIFGRGYEFPSRVANSLQSPFLLAVRLYWGWQLMQGGWGKLHNLAGVTDFFTSLGLPAPHFTAIAISNLELFGGALLALGLGSRLIGLVLTGNMFMAYVTADHQALLSIFSDPGKFYNADPFTFLLASLLVLVFGPGFFSVDRILQAIRDSNSRRTMVRPHGSGPLQSPVRYKRQLDA